MSIPEVTQTISDGALGVLPPNASKVQVKLGVCSAGAPNTVYSFADAKLMQDTIGRGPVVEAAAQVLNVAGGPVMIVPVLPSVVGSIGSTTLVGSGTATVTGGKALDRIVKIKIITGGALATATFQVAIGSGAYGSTVTTGTPGTWSYRIPGAPLVVANFAVGTYVANDVFQINLDGSVTRTGSGTATLLDTSTAEPLDDYAVRVKIVTAGALGAAVFQYSLDGGDNYSGQILVPSGGVYIIPNAGVKLTFSGTFVAADVYSIAVTGPSFSSSDVATAIDALFADPRKWFLLHVVGKATSAANAATMAGAVDAKMTTAETAFRYARALVECPHDVDIGGSNTDSAAISAFASYSNTRMSIAIGDAELVSPLTGRTERRSIGWSYAARLSAIAPGESPAWVNRGALKGVASIYRDEAKVQALNDQRFVTARTIIGRQGYYITDGKTMAVAGSDFGDITNCRVMDIACDTTRNALL
ncbi:MAG: DUF2586 family protein, partial [Salinibacterium sp.]